jgi:phosphate starvation-inducible protein PhoH
MSSDRLTKKQRRALRQQEVLEKDNSINTSKFSINFKPQTENQWIAHAEWLVGNHLLLHGYAGTGKTYIAMAMALKDVLDERFKSLKIIRSAVPTRDIGFLPGTAKQKLEVYEQPYKQIANNLFKRGDAYDILCNKFMVEFVPTSFIRGTTLDNCVVLVDEINNMTFHELDSVITRLGDNTQLILCGDHRQSDLYNQREMTGIKKFMDIVQKLPDFKRVEFNTRDIVRGKLVKDYIIEKYEQGYV